MMIVLAGYIPYSNVLNASFVFDDFPNIVTNPAVKSLSNFLPGGIVWSQIPTRFIGYLSFALNYRFGGLDVSGYHLTNIFLHIVNALLVYALAFLVQTTPGFLQGKETHPSKGLPVLCALLFAVHPVQTQAVSYIVQRFASLATMFYLGAVVAFIKARLTMKGVREGEGGGPVPWYVVSLGCALLAMKTKEIAFTLPAVVALAEASFFRGDWRKRLALVFPYLMVAMVIPLSLISTEQPLGKILSDASEKTHLETDLTRVSYLLTQFRVIATYFRLLLFPANQNLDYDFPASGSLLDPQVLLSLLLLLLLLGAAVFLFVKSRAEGDGRFRLAAFGIIWFFAALAVESSVIPIADVIFEHRVYLPSVGAFVSLASLASLAFGHVGTPKKNILAVILSGFIVIALAGATYSRNRVWQANLVLWEDVAVKSPGKARPHYNLGVAYEEKGRFREAIVQYRTALEIRRGYHEAQNNLGVLYAKTGWIDNAIRHFEAAVELEPGDAGYRINLSQAYSIKGYPEKAKEQKMLAERLSSVPK